MSDLSVTCSIDISISATIIYTLTSVIFVTCVIILNRKSRRPTLPDERSNFYREVSIEVANPDFIRLSLATHLRPSFVAQSTVQSQLRLRQRQSQLVSGQRLRR